MIRASELIESARVVSQRLSYARALLSSPLSLETVENTIRSAVAARDSTFLNAIEQTIFAHARSPYRPLLQAAGYDLPRVRALVHREGVEATLRHLSRDGVYVTIEEFKGHREVCRADKTFRFAETDFDNPLVTTGLRIASGGTRSRGIPTTISLENHRMGAEHLGVALAAYGLQKVPIMLWMSIDHGATDWAVLALGLLGRMPARWFTQIRGGPRGRLSLPYRWFVRTWALALGLRLPQPIAVGFGEEARILRAISQEAPEGCAVFTTPSAALRLCLAAKKSGMTLANVSFLTIAEPLTPAKLAAIHAVGARCYSSFGFAEFGRATYGCVSPASPDDMHICRDAASVIARRRPVDQLGTEVDALLVTSLRPDARRILLNMETGDYARLTRRRCGCLLEEVGWIDHLEEVRSFEKLNAEGRRFLGSDLISFVEEVLPARFGGDATDYQLLEEEDQDGFTRLSVVVHPRLGPIDEAAIIAAVEGTLVSTKHQGWDRYQRSVGVRIWKEADTVRVRRAAPMLTKAGKLLPLHHLQPRAATK